MKATVLSYALAILSALNVTQISIDATRPMRERQRLPSSGGVGSSGYKLPIEINLERKIAGECDAKKVAIEFALSNRGTKSVEIPISPNPGDFEPKDATMGYTVKVLRLYLSVDTKEPATRQTEMLPGGAALFGSQSSAGTLIDLAPNEAINVLGCVTPLAATATSSRVIVGRIELENETVKTVQGNTSSAIQEVGSAESRDYNPNIMQVAEK